MGFIVNLTAFLILITLSVLLIRQGLVDLEQGFGGTIFFLFTAAIFFVTIARSAYYNMFDRRKRDSMGRFLDNRSNAQIRGRPDYILRTVAWLDITSWALFIVVIITLKETFSNQLGMHGSIIDGYTHDMNPVWGGYTLVTCLLSVVVSGLALALKSRRNNRGNDSYPKSLIFVFSFSVLVFAVLLLFDIEDIKSH